MLPAESSAPRLGERLVGPTARASTRLAVAVAAGLAVGAVASSWSAWQLSLLLGWNGFSACFLLPAWWLILGSNSDRTAAIATIEDESRRAAGLVLLLASTASLLAVAVGLVKANQVDGVEEVLLAVTAVLAIVGAWATVNTYFAFHYAKLYYEVPVGGIDFGGEVPDYMDFVYVSFTIGMTYQVSDTTIQDRVIRRSITRHALMSYLFGTGIIATTINIVASFFR